MESSENSTALVNPEAPRRRRRYHTKAFKRELVKLVHQGEQSLAQIAMTHQINANLLRRWVTDEAKPTEKAAMMPVHVLPGPDSVVEIDVLATTVRVTGVIDPVAIAALIKALR